ncbi:hypothetical protein DSM106972_017160 [Dulcicalothrix desertica PCC 7102]|uniref:VCBS repeat-containing protein n=2 Tax=Dulcicalothrix desertica TaxID=32056 RepID=A0A3S1BBC1_9CYAN|nr:hypothetical protein DSM106972_017160 [Dulcicalothrix desertica PCC 7102]
MMGIVSFSPTTNFNVGSGPLFLAAGDLNGDRRTDLVTTNNNGNSLSVLLGIGNGSFSSASSFDTEPFPFAVAIGDFNDDGRSDECGGEPRLQRRLCAVG